MSHAQIFSWTILLHEAKFIFSGGKLELNDIKERLKKDIGTKDSEIYTFGWQEKVFSRVSIFFFFGLLQNLYKFKNTLYCLFIRSILLVS